MARRLFVIGTVLALIVGLCARAGGQSPPPPCTAADIGPNPPSMSALDGDDTTQKGGLTATHSIFVRLDEGSAPFPSPDDNAIQWSLPPGVTQSKAKGEQRMLLDLGPTKLAIFMDNGGSYPLTASWPGDTGAGLCTVTVTFNVEVQAATPLRLSNPNRRHKVEALPGWDWRQVFGPHADLRPIQIMYRSVARRKFPTGPFRTHTAVLRTGEAGYNDGIDHFLKLHRWQLDAVADNTKFDLQGKVRGHGIHERALGYEVKLVQGGRQLGDLRVAARCGIFDCRNSRVKLQR